MDGETFIKRLEPGWRPLIRFWQWWIPQLQSLLPTSWQRRLRRQSQTLSLSPQAENGQWQLSLSGTDLTLSINDEPTPEQTRQLSELIRHSARVELVLAEDALLHTQITLPRATAFRLDSVLTFEMDKHTPFTANDVYFGYRILPGSPKDDHIQVSMLLLPKTQLDPQLEQLAQWNLHPQALRCGTHPEAPLIQLNSPDHAGKIQKRRQKTMRDGALLLMLLLLFAVPLYQRQGKIEDLNTALLIPRERAEQAARVKEQLDMLKTSQTFIIAAKSAANSTLNIIDELTRIIPEHTWLSRLDINDDNIRLTGESANASELIGVIDASSRFHNVRFTSPVTSNPRTSKDRFSIEAGITAGEEG